jgi:hypothetical protein
VAEAVETSVQRQGVESAKSARKAPAHAGRFLVAYLVLGLVAGVAIAAAVVLATAEDPAPPPAWSSWRPTGAETRHPQQIATYVSQRYRLPSGNQLVAVLAGPPEVPVAEDATRPVTHIALISDGSSGDDIVATEVGDHGVIYRLCGIGGGNCAIVEGQPTEERHRLLRREALELALYTFRYNEETQTVVVLMPPRPDSDRQPDAIYFRRSQLEPQMKVPLAATLPRGDDDALVGVPPQEAVKIDALTLPFLYRWTYELTQDQSGIVLFLSRDEG